MYGVYIVDKTMSAIGEVINAADWTGCGYEIVGSNTDSLTAFHEIKELRPSLVVCEWEMPDMTGLDLLRSLKRTPVGCEFIMLAGTESVWLLRETFASGGSDYMVKPLGRRDTEKTLTRIYSRIEGRKRQDAEEGGMPVMKLKAGC